MCEYLEKKIEKTVTICALPKEEEQACSHIPTTVTSNCSSTGLVDVKDRSACVVPTGARLTANLAANMVV